MQRNWIGRSEGAEVDLRRGRTPASRVPVFTTRPDTVFGATFVVLAPEHPLVPQLTAGPSSAPRSRRTSSTARTETEIERADADREKTGVFTGALRDQPGRPASAIPIWIADYVLMQYGTGAIMAVPGHDERDFEFAPKFGLPIVARRRERGGDDELPYTGRRPAGELRAEFDGMHDRRGAGGDRRLARRERARAAARSPTACATG